MSISRPAKKQENLQGFWHAGELWFSPSVVPPEGEQVEALFIYSTGETRVDSYYVLEGDLLDPATLRSIDTSNANFKGWRRKSSPPLERSINHPKHYNHGKYECIDVIHDWGLGFNLGNALKYICRADHKDCAIKDLQKAEFYIKDEIKRRQNGKS